MIERAGNMERRLVGILSADVRGYSRLMADDELATVRILNIYREVIREITAKHHGRIVDAPGDNILAEFNSAIQATECAVEIQRELASRNRELPENRRMEFRIGVHLGDVMVQDDHIYGDGVNIAARLERLSEPGGVCISRAVHEQTRRRLQLECDDLGEQTVKNIPEPIRAYRIRLDGVRRTSIIQHRRDRRLFVLGAAGAALVAAAIVGVHLHLERTPVSPAPKSIAVLPLENLSGDQAQEYFADGMTDELITKMAAISALRVISRTSVMRYKGEHHQPLSEIAKTLKVDAVVEGSAMRIGNRVRITAQLIDAASDKHLWAETYERDSRDVLALQDDVASSIAREVGVHLTPDERSLLTSARPVNPEAYEAYLVGRYNFGKDTRDGREKARQYFQRAIDIDPSFALGYASLSNCYWESSEQDLPCTAALPKAKELAEKALQLDDSLAEAHAVLGGVILQHDYDWAAAERELKRAIALNPGYARAHEDYSGCWHSSSGRPARLLHSLRRCSPSIR